MDLSHVWQQIANSISELDFWGITALVAGLLTVYYLIKENILTWPFGILYTVVSLVVFWKARLYGDLLLHVFYLVLNIYGWIYWVRGRKSTNEVEVPVTQLNLKPALVILAGSIFMIYVFGQFLIQIPNWIDGVEPPSLPYWDSATSMLSVTAMWLTARKKIDNWYYWFAIDILATGIYFYKGLYFYFVLYLIYIAMAVAGYLAWKKSLETINP